MAAKAKAFFTITGEYLTKVARDLMLEDEPGKAYRLIAETLIGEGAAEVARKVLIGEINLIGDSTVGIGIEAAEGQLDADEYIKSMRWLYAGRVRLQGRWYRPRGVVTSYGPEDAREAVKLLNRDELSVPSFVRARAQFYANEGERVEFVHKCGDATAGFKATTGVYVMFEPCGELPFWIKPAADAQAAVLDLLSADRAIEHIGSDRALRLNN